MRIFLDDYGISRLRDLGSLVVVFDTSSLVNEPEKVTGCLRQHQVVVIPDFIRKQLNVVSLDREQKENKKSVLGILRRERRRIVTLDTGFSEPNNKALLLVDDQLASASPRASAVGQRA